MLYVCDEQKKTPKSCPSRGDGGNLSLTWILDLGSRAPARGWFMGPAARWEKDFGSGFVHVRVKIVTANIRKIDNICSCYCMLVGENSLTYFKFFEVLSKNMWLSLRLGIPRPGQPSFPKLH